MPPPLRPLDEAKLAAKSYIDALENKRKVQEGYNTQTQATQAAETAREVLLEKLARWLQDVED